MLLDNAAQHGQGAVTIAIRDAPPNAIAVDVIDEGVTLVEDQTELFRLRTRSEDSAGHSSANPHRRGNSQQHSNPDGDVARHGLGLALARRIAESEGGRLQLTNAHPTTFTLLVPATPPPASPTSPAAFPA